ncbi:MAG: hypothetical protein GXO86_14925 [Chlorobi bacterium]|nr:hypothetical protein [Chlorobiota bacterium]
MKNKENITSENHEQEHVSSYSELFGTWAALIILTGMTVFISISGANLRTLTIATALLIASVKALVVGFYFMHLKFETRLYRIMIIIVMALFTFFLIMVILDYLTR